MYGLMLLMPGVFMLALGIKLLTRPAARDLCWLLGMGVCVLTATLSVVLAGRFADPQDPYAFSILMPTFWFWLLLVSLPIYFIATTRLLRWLGYDASKPSDVFGKIGLGLIAVVGWRMLSILLFAWLDPIELYARSIEGPRFGFFTLFATLILPVVPALLLYSVLESKLCRVRVKRSAEVGEESA